MIAEGSHDTENWINDVENDILEYFKIVMRYFNITIFGQINAAFLSIREKNLTNV